LRLPQEFDHYINHAPINNANEFLSGSPIIWFNPLYLRSDTMQISVPMITQLFLLTFSHLSRSIRLWSVRWRSRICPLNAWIWSSPGSVGYSAREMFRSYGHLGPCQCNVLLKWWDATVCQFV
jgi:hypothetical protein